MKENQFDGLMRGHAIIRQIREGVKNSPRTTPISTIVNEVIIDNDYHVSAKQQKVLEQSLPTADEHRTATKRASWLVKHQPHALTSKIAQVLECSPESIGHIDIHESSITAVIENKVLAEECNRLNQMFEIDGYQASNIAGLASERFKIKVQKKGLPFSIQNKKFTDSRHSHVAEHENLHVQYHYLHPKRDMEETSAQTPQEYVEELTKRSEKAIQNHDEDSFRNILREINHGQLYLFLNELSSESLTNHHDVLDQAFGGREGTHSYTQIYERRLTKIKDTILKSSDTILPWLDITDQEYMRTYHKASFIQNAYFQLAQQGTPPEELVSIAEFLTPESGFAIQAFVDGEPTFSKMKEWKRNYEEPEIPPLTNYELMLNAMNIDSTKIEDNDIDDFSYKTAITNTVNQIDTSVIKSFKERQASNEGIQNTHPIPLTETYQGLIAELYAVQKDRLTLLNKFIQKGIVAENDEETKKQLYKASIDFDQIFFLAWEYEKNSNFSLVKNFSTSYVEQQPEIALLSFQLDDAVEDLVASLTQGKDTNPESFFQPNYTPSAEKQERRYTCLMTEGEITTNGASPLEDEALTLFNNIITGQQQPSDFNQKAFRRLLSMCMRTNLWAKNNGITIPNGHPMRALLNGMVRNGVMLPAYNDLSLEQLVNAQTKKS